MKTIRHFSSGALGAACLLWGVCAGAQTAAVAPPANAAPSTARTAAAAPSSSAAPANASSSTAPTSAATGAATASASEPVARGVDRLQEVLIDAMRHAKALGYKGRYKQLDPVVREVFDFPFISRVVMGTEWTKLDADQQHQLQEALARLSVSSYAKEFDGYSGQKFVFDGSRTITGGKLVRYVYRSGNDRIHFDYQMHRDSTGTWRIANVIVDGVSDLALKSGQYRSLFAKKGFKGLVAWIDKQVKGNGG